jgi:O-acetyl-ADP-ribose deacetylase
MPFEILRNDITKMEVDAIVSSANANHEINGGVEQAIHLAAGNDLMRAKKMHNTLTETKAIITPGYLLKAKYVIHVHAPIYQQGQDQEEMKLFSTYMNALSLANQHRIKSIAFPLLSTGLFRFPKDSALKIAVNAIKTFLYNHDMMIYLVVYDQESYQTSLKHFDDVKSYIDEYLSDYDQKMINEVRPANLDEEVRAQIVSKFTAPSTRQLDDLFEQIGETFVECLFRHIDYKGYDDIEIYKKANIDRKLFSKMKSNYKYQPSKLTAIAFALALELNLDEAKDLIEKAGYALSKSHRFDLVIEYFIEKAFYDLFEINQILFNLGEKTIGGIEN